MIKFRCYVICDMCYVVCVSCVRYLCIELLSIVLSELLLVPFVSLLMRTVSFQNFMFVFAA